MNVRKKDKPSGQLSLIRASLSNHEGFPYLHSNYSRLGDQCSTTPNMPNGFHLVTVGALFLGTTVGAMLVRYSKYHL